ncbi:hypothetical protein [Kitasatospora sp. NPDC088134]|uniref:hypothetical protein n=1 Tax=Kitasatospora sp. NPDC088134 TaxID=3364071 RepID=UPI0038193632
MSESLPDDVADVLGVLLDGDGDGAREGAGEGDGGGGGGGSVRRALRAQVPQLRVRRRCGCGCGSAYFEQLDPAAVRPAACGPGTVVVAEALIRTEDGDCPGEVLVFAQGGYLSWLEVCSWSDTTEVTLALARRALLR